MLSLCRRAAGTLLEYLACFVFLSIAAYAATYYGPKAFFAGVQTVYVGEGLSGPTGLLLDTSGNLYVADTGNNRVLKIAPDGTQTVILSGTVASLPLSAPNALAFDPTGDLYVSDSGNNRVLKVTPSNTVTALGSKLSHPSGVAVGPGGYIYVSDSGNNRLVRIGPAGYQQAINSCNSCGQYPLHPAGLTFPTHNPQFASGELCVADEQFPEILCGHIATGFAVAPYTPFWVRDYINYQITGTSLNGAMAFVPLSPPGRESSSSSSGWLSYGNSYIADAGNNRVVADSEFTDLKGNQFFFQTTVTTGLSSPAGLAADTWGNVYIADTGNNRILKLSTSPSVDFGALNIGSSGTAELTFSFLAGSNWGYSPVLTGGQPSLDFKNAGTGTCPTTTENLYDVCTVDISFAPTLPGARAGAFKLAATIWQAPVYLHGIGVGPQIAYDPGVQSTIATGLASPRGLAVDGGGNVYTGDFGNGQILKISPTGTQSEFAALSGVSNLSIDGAGNLLAVGDTGMYRISKAGVVPASAEISSTLGPVSSAVDPAGNVFAALVSEQQVSERAPDGIHAYSFNGGFSPGAVAVDGHDNLYVVDDNDWLVWKVTPQHNWSTVGGGYDRPSGVAIDQQGNVYVADFGNDRVVKTTPEGVQTTVGSGLNEPTAVAVDSRGNIYIADFGNSRVVKIDRSTIPTLNFAATPVGQVSADSPQMVTMENIGNADLAFTIPKPGFKNPVVASNFNLDAGSTCPQLTSSSDGETLTPGASCFYAVNFMPGASGAFDSSMNVFDDNLNHTGFQSIHLNGTGIPPAGEISDRANPPGK